MGTTTPPDADALASIRRLDDQGEHWLATDIMSLLGYTSWALFLDVVERAQASADAAGAITGQFARQSGTGAQGGPVAEPVDYRLSRYAAYLVIMNGNPRYVGVAVAQAYLARLATATAALDITNGGVEWTAPRSASTNSEAAVVKMWVAKRCRPAPDDPTPALELYEAFAAEQQGISVTRFGRTLTDLGFAAKRSNSGGKFRPLRVVGGT